MQINVSEERYRFSSSGLIHCATKDRKKMNKINLKKKYSENAQT